MTRVVIPCYVIRTEPQTYVPRMYRVLIEACTETRQKCFDHSILEDDEHPHLNATSLMNRRKLSKLALEYTAIMQIKIANKVDKFLKYHDPMFEAFEKGFKNFIFLIQLFVEKIEEIYQICCILNGSVFFIISDQKLTRFPHI